MFLEASVSHFVSGGCGCITGHMINGSASGEEALSRPPPDAGPPGLPQGGWEDPPPMQTHWSCDLSLQRSVRILLECILVCIMLTSRTANWM